VAEASRRARIEARRRRIAAREARQDEHGPLPNLEESDAQGSSAREERRTQHSDSPLRGLSPVCEEEGMHASSGQRRGKPARPMNRADHQDIFGARSSAVEGLVDAPTLKPAKKRGDQDLGVTANTLDLDFSSVERASARLQRSTKAGSMQGGIAAPEDKGKERGGFAASVYNDALLPAEKTSLPRGKGESTVKAAGAHAAGKVLITDEEQSALHRLMVGPREEADGLTVKTSDGKQVACDGAIGEEGVQAIDVKAMDRLARQNDELRKLAEAQRRELERFQQLTAQQQQAAHAQAARTFAPGVTAAPDPWQGGLKERGVRKYLDSVAKVQAGAQHPESPVAIAVHSGIDEAGVNSDYEFEQHMHHLQWRRTAPASTKLQHMTTEQSHGDAQAPDAGKRRALAVSSKATDEEDETLRRERRDRDLKALGLDPSIDEQELPRAAAAKISELEAELERLRLESVLEEGSGDEDGDEAGSAAPVQASSHGVAKGGRLGSVRSKQVVVAAVDISSSEDEDVGAVDDILAHEREAGHAGLGPEEAARLERELNRLKAELEEAPRGELARALAPEQASFRDETRRVGMPSDAVEPAAGKGSAQKKEGWGSKLKTFFFGKGSDKRDQGSKRDASSVVGQTAPAAAVSGHGQGPDDSAPVPRPSAGTLMPKPPMATPSEQGSVKLSIKVAPSSQPADSNSAADAKAPLRMMSAMPEDDADFFDMWSDDEYPFNSGALAGQESAAGHSAHGEREEDQMESTPRIEQKSALLRVTSVVRRSGEDKQDAMMEADAMLNAYAPPPRKVPSGVSSALPKGGDDSRVSMQEQTVGHVPSFDDIEALMQRVKDKMQYMEDQGNNSTAIVEEISQLKARVGAALAAMEQAEEGDQALKRSGHTHGVTPKLAADVGRQPSAHGAAGRGKDDKATPRMDSVAAHVAQQRVQASMPGHVPPMLSSFLKSMEEAEPLPPLSQRGFPDEMDSAALSDDDDMADCVSVISMATAVMDKGELQRQIKARPAPRHHRPVHVTRPVSEAVGFSGDSPSAYFEGNEQDRWLNDSTDSPRSKTAASVAQSEQTQVMSAQVFRARGGAADAQLRATRPVVKGGAHAEAVACRDADARQEEGLRQEEGVRTQHATVAQQSQKEQLIELQRKLQMAAARVTTAGTNRSFVTEYSDQLDPRDLMQTPKLDNHLASQPDKRVHAAKLNQGVGDAILSAPAGARGHDHGVDEDDDEGWSDYSCNTSSHGHLSQREVPDARALKLQQRAAERAAGRRTLAEFAQQRPGTGVSGNTAVGKGRRPRSGGSATSRALAEDENIFEDSDEHEYEEGHEGITKRQDQIIAENMALVLGADAGSSSGAVRDGEDDDSTLFADLDGTAVQPAAALVAPTGLTHHVEENENSVVEELDPLMAEMKQKAKLRAQHARALEEANVPSVFLAALPPAEAVAEEKAGSPDTSGTKAVVKETGRHAARSKTERVSVGKAGAVMPEEEDPATAGSRDSVAIGQGELPMSTSADKMKLHKSFKDTQVSQDDEATPRLNFSRRIRHGDHLIDHSRECQPAHGRLEHDNPRAEQHSKEVLGGRAGDDSKQQGPSKPHAHVRPDDNRPFSPDVPVVEKRKKQDASVPLVKMKPRPLSATSTNSFATSATPRQRAETQHQATEPVSEARDRPASSRQKHTDDGDEDAASTSGREGGGEEEKEGGRVTPTSPGNSVSNGVDAGSVSGKDVADQGVRKDSPGDGSSSEPDLPKGEAAGSWLTENEQVAEMKARAARPLSARDEVLTTLASFDIHPTPPPSL
jgi:hypothetical protein